MNHLRAAMQTFQKPSDLRITIPWSSRLGLISGNRHGSANQRSRHVAAWAVALVLGLLVGAGNIRAQSGDFIWTNGNDVWTSPTAWDTNGSSGPVGIPYGATSGAWFTNGTAAGVTYYVTVDTDLEDGSNFFGNAGGTIATVTFDLSTSQFAFDSGITIGDGANSTTTVYFAGNTRPGIYTTSAGLTIGRNGVGKLIVTNGTYDLAGVSFGGGTGGQGTLILSGSNTKFYYGENGGGFAVGNNTNSFGNSVVVSNGAFLGSTMANRGTFRFGSGAGASGAGSSNNTFELVYGGRFASGSGTITIGNGSTVTGVGAYNNIVTVGTNCSFDCSGDGTTHGIFVGTSKATPASNNVLRIVGSGAVTNFSLLVITASNTVDLVGGLIGGRLTPTNFNGGTVSNWGIIQGYGTHIGAMVIASNGLLSTSNSLGSLVITNNLSLNAGSIMQVALGTTTYPIAIGTNLTIQASTLNITDSGGLSAPNAYTLMTYAGTMTYQSGGLTIGTAPANVFYIVDLRTSHTVLLNVISNSAVTAPVANFSPSTTNSAQYATVTFTNTSSGTYTNSVWYFGDNSTNTYGAMFNPAHTYTNAGIYTVTLAVTGPLGTSTLVSNNAVTAHPATASFTNNPTSGAPPLQVLFYDTSDSNGSAFTNQFWNFGDGHYATNWLTENGNPVTNTYAIAGVYTAMLTRCGSVVGCSNYTGIITVSACSYLGPPVASFSGSPVYGPALLSVTFTNTSTDWAGDGQWNFGDTSTLSTPALSVVHNYGVGTYTVCLTVTNCFNTFSSSTTCRTNYITALDPYVWWASNYFGCVGCAQAQPGADPDGDAVINTNEFLAGTDPTKSFSALRIASVVRQTNDVTITWTTVGGHTNAVQATLGVGGYYNSANVWGDLATFVITGSGDKTNNYTDVGGATANPAKYYRIRLVP
jgi:PKD repeat protein